MAFEVTHLMQAFENQIFCTVVRELIRFQLAARIAGSSAIAGPLVVFTCVFVWTVFSERELRNMLSPVRLSSVCNVRAPYSGGSNFPQYFYGVRYLGHPVTSFENFTEIVPENPSAGGVKHKSGSQVSTAIYRKRCKI